MEIHSVTTGTYESEVQGGHAAQFGTLDFPASDPKLKGIVFTHTSDGDAPPSGGYQWVQITKMDIHFEKVEPNATTTRWKRVTPGFVLDDVPPNDIYPYSTDNPTSDSPYGGWPNDFIEYTRHDDFKMYLEWKWRLLTPYPDAIYVPLRVTAWHWGFTAGFVDEIGWIVDADPNNSVNPPDQETTEFAQWKTKVSKFKAPNPPVSDT